MISGSQIPLVNFPEIKTPDVKSPWGTALQSALSTYGTLQDIQGKNYQNTINQAKAQYAPQMSYAELQQAQALPQKTAAETAYQNALAHGQKYEDALKTAQAAQAQEDAEKTRRGLPFIAPQAQADIEEKKAMSNYYNQGGGRGGVANQTERAFENSVLADNPHITDPDQQRELINVVTNGGTQLSDGIKVNPMSDITKRAYDRALKTTTTTNLINQNVQANQAAAELPVYKQYIDEGVKPYGTTVMGVSPLQVKDSLDIHNHEAQARIGKYLAAQQLLYDRSALMLKINALPAGQKIASKIAALSSQTINSKFPTQSAESRQIASDTVAKALMEGLEARNKFGVNVSNAFKGNNQQNAQANPVRTYNLQSGKFE
jgi:hypothetical protein